MVLFEQISDIISGMMKNKLRIFLTMLGVIVGVCAVIIIISVGMTATGVVQMYFAGTLGNNRVSAYLGARNGKDFRISYDELTELGFSDPLLHGVLFETADALNGKAIIDDTHYTLGKLKGVSSNYFEANQKDITEGRFLNLDDCRQGRSSAVISDVAAESCFGSVENSLGKPMTFRTETGFQIDAVVVGVYTETDLTGKLEKTKDKRSWYSDIYCTYEYINSVQNIDVRQQKYSDFSVIVDKSTDSAAMTSLIEYIDQRLAERSSDPDYLHSCYRGFSQSEEMNGLVTALSVVFVAAAILTLIVGGISLMNTMLVIVKERTREIGTRKAIGASNPSIVGQFLLESIMICLIACLIGVLLSGLIIFIINMNLGSLFDLISDAGMRSFLRSSDVRLNMNGLAVAVSVTFSVLVGVFFGVYPSVKAAKMEITDALRYE